MRILSASAEKTADVIETMTQHCRQILDPEVSSFRICPEEEIPSVKKKSVTTYAYSNRVIRDSMASVHNPMLGAAVFDQNGWLIRLYGRAEFREWAARRGIVPFSNWLEDSAGVNAVSVGMACKASVEMFGGENYCSLLRDTAIYFTPYILDLGQTFDREDYRTLGGVAIITPLGDGPEDYLFTTEAIAKEVALHLHMVQCFEEFFNTETEGHISIDFDLATSVPHLLYHSNNIYKILGIGERNLHFEPVGTVFDPLPKNREFWRIVNEGMAVQNRRITLCIQGVEREFTIRTLPYQQRFIGFKGVHIFLQSQKLKTSSVSKDVGNIAQLTFEDIVGESPVMVQTIRQAKTLSASDHTMLILGESGVGKDLFARAIHSFSRRSQGPFVTLNCAAIPRELIASELFGYSDGAFTGAKRGGNMGKFELADSGTIFLDEIGDMPLELQATLLDVIESKSFMRVGSNVRRKVDVRVIAATNADMAERIYKRQFREDLFYRLSATQLSIPPLRARGTDIVLLAEYFISSLYNDEAFKPQPILSAEAKRLLMSLPWRGNVRELRNVITNVVSLYDDHIISAEHIQRHLVGSKLYTEPYPAETLSYAASNGYGRNRTITKEELEDCLRKNQYQKAAAARSLGISRKTLYRWLKQFDLA
ncbi:MAG: sigma 54-interacting transcriptional regulator [Oscillospiraceae bacterium]|nr:sigma 54-interacting transcriptional regulator [Oscillospiraceae bacterium]